MTTGTINKSGNELWAEQNATDVLDYALDWSDFGEPVTGSIWVGENPLVTSQATISSGLITACHVTGGVPRTWYRLTNRVTGDSGRAASKTIMLFILDSATQPIGDYGSALFPNRFSVIASLRRDRLVTAVASMADVSDDYLWEKIRSAEADVRQALRVPLAPTRFFPVTPTADEIAALAGMPWGIDPGYDLGPENNMGDRWGMIKTRQKPIISIERYRFAYPLVDGTGFDVPASWLRPDKKYGMISVVPAGHAASVPLSAIVMQALSAGRTVPLMLTITYTAGLENAARDYPNLIDVVKKLAVVKALEDRLLPSSGSVSADGLSQSVSVDMDKYRDNVESVLYGPKGSNGGLMAAIHGVRGMVY